MTGRAGTPEASHARPPSHRWRVPVVAVVVVLALVAAILFATQRTADAPSELSSAPGASSTVGSDGAGDPGEPTEPTTGATTSTAPPVPAGPTEITLAFAGDLLPHLPLVAQAGRYGAPTGRRYDFGPMFEPMRPILEPVDAAVCHMEVPVSPDQDDLSGYPAFGTAAELVDAAKGVGYDGCSTASNHSLDRGRDGIAATLEAFDRAGLRHAGTARSEQEATTTTTYDVDGVRVAHLSYAYGFNGYPIPADAPWAVNQIDVAAIKAAAATARAEGAQLVVLSLHWGNEYQHDPSDEQRRVADELLPDENLDLVIGHHAHVVQPIERVEGTLVVWGLGNQLANQMDVPKADGLTVVVTATPKDPADPDPKRRWSPLAIIAVPTFVERDSFRILPIVATLADPATPPGLRDLLVASYDRTAEVLARTPTEGVFLPPRP